MNLLQVEAQRLVELIETEAQRNIRGTPQWIVSEGERVVENVHAFRKAVDEGSVDTLLSGIPLIQFLGVSWVELHEPAYLQCHRIQEIIEAQTNAI